MIQFFAMSDRTQESGSRLDQFFANVDPVFRKCRSHRDLERKSRVAGSAMSLSNFPKDKTLDKPSTSTSMNDQKSGSLLF